MLAVQRIFYAGFVTVLIACFTPFKMLAYLLPILFTLWVGLSTPAAIVRNRLVALLVVIAILPVFYYLLVAEFLITNYLLAVLTYSTAIPILVIDGRALASRELLHRTVVATSTMVGIQGVIGVVQALYGVAETGTFSFSTGDRVMGTIHPSLTAEGLGANPMFAINMALMLLACLLLPHMDRKRGRAAFYVGTCALVFASVIHVLVLLVVAGVTAVVLTRTRKLSRGAGRLARTIAIASVLAGAFTYFAMRENIAQLGSTVETTLDLEAGLTPRTVLLYGVVTELPEDAPSQPLVGLGPGQFSSRASLIASGLFVGGPESPRAVPLLTPQSTQLAQDYCFSLLMTYASQLDYIGSSQQPFFSVLSIYTELGIVGLALIALWLVRLFLRIRRRVLEQPELRFLSAIFVAGTSLVFLIGIVENYWEMPQAILIGALVLKVMHANIVHGRTP